MAHASRFTSSIDWLTFLYAYVHTHQQPLFCVIASILNSVKAHQSTKVLLWQLEHSTLDSRGSLEMWSMERPPRIKGVCGQSDFWIVFNCIIWNLKSCRTSFTLMNRSTSFLRRKCSQSKKRRNRTKFPPKTVHRTRHTREKRCKRCCERSKNKNNLCYEMVLFISEKTRENKKTTKWNKEKADPPLATKLHCDAAPRLCNAAERNEKSKRKNARPGGQAGKHNKLN